MPPPRPQPRDRATPSAPSRPLPRPGRRRKCVFECVFLSFFRPSLLVRLVEAAAADREACLVFFSPLLESLVGASFRSFQLFVCFEGRLLQRQRQKTHHQGEQKSVPIEKKNGCRLLDCFLLRLLLSLLFFFFSPFFFFFPLLPFRPALSKSK